MDEKMQPVTRMLNGFPSTTDSFDLLLDTYRRQLADLSAEAVERAANRFLAGDVPGQQKRFAPTVPEFVEDARRCQDVLDMQARPRLAPPVYRRGPLAPFEIKMEKARAENAHLPLLFENVGYDQWRKLSQQNQIPVGAKWVAAIGVVYGPEPRHQIEGKAA